MVMSLIIPSNTKFSLRTEREDSVKCDIFNAYRALLRQTRPIASASYDPDAMDEENRQVLNNKTSFCKLC